MRSPSQRAIRAFPCARNEVAMGLQTIPEWIYTLRLGHGGTSAAFSVLAMKANTVPIKQP